MIDKDSVPFRKASAAYLNLPSRRPDGKYNDCRDRLAAALEVWDDETKHKPIDDVVWRSVDNSPFIFYPYPKKALEFIEGLANEFDEQSNLSKRTQKKTRQTIGSGFLRLAKDSPLSRIRKRAMRSLSLPDSEEQRDRVQADV